MRKQKGEITAADREAAAAAREKLKKQGLGDATGLKAGGPRIASESAHQSVTVSSATLIDVPRKPD